HFVARDGSRAGHGDVARARAGIERIAHRGLEQIGILWAFERKPKRHGEAQDRAERIGNALPGDVGRAAVHRIVARGQPAVLERPERSGGSMPSEPTAIAAQSERMSPNMLSVTITSKCLGSRTSCMAQLSTYMWRSVMSLNSAAWSAVTSSRQS